MALRPAVALAPVRPPAAGEVRAEFLLEPENFMHLMSVGLQVASTLSISLADGGSSSSFSGWNATRLLASLCRVAWLAS